tara:strand:+ start:479 stop:973 length:495 start_codon:yes stop_codon:yes gene_type:complete
MRHGQTQDADASSESFLQEAAVRDLKDVGLVFRKRRISCVYTSPALCAVETAQAITYFQDVDISFNSKLADVPEECTQEELETLQKSVSTFLRELCVKHNGERICLVSHKLVLQILMADILLLPLTRLKELEVRHGTVSIVRYDGEIELKHMDCPVNAQDAVFS